MTDRLRCPVCQAEEGRVQFITTEIDPEYVGAEDDDSQIIPGTAGWVGGTDEATARIDIAGACGHNWSVLIRQSDLRVRYRVYRDEQKPDGPFMPRRQDFQISRDEKARNQLDAAFREGIETLHRVMKPELKPRRRGNVGPRSEAAKTAARERMQALWAQARAEGLERPGGKIRRQPPAASDNVSEDQS